MKAALACIFFVSGVAALLFESLWFRQAQLAFGSSVTASALVVLSFTAGLAIGSGVSARRGDGIARPLRTYALLQLGVGGLGL